MENPQSFTFIIFALPLASLAVVRGVASYLGAHASGTHGLGTERTRLTVQRKTSLRHFAAYRSTSLRSWFQKKWLLPRGILIFFSKIPQILKLEVGFFFISIVFRLFFSKIGKYLSYLNFIFVNLKKK